MYLIGFVTYPQESGPEVAKRFKELGPVPDFITIRGPLVRSSLDGTKSITIYRFDPTRYAEAAEYIYKRAATYVGIPGYRYSVEEWRDVKDALKTAGLD
ncbi:MAG: hypothetical protein JSW39_19795 [Desulfobacterales bacterium]|nr:MAG: hypothetical protein JSW39_19795 [Desulfobacterales bacterium]